MGKRPNKKFVKNKVHLSFSTCSKFGSILKIIKLKNLAILFSLENPFIKSMFIGQQKVMKKSIELTVIL